MIFSKLNKHKIKITIEKKNWAHSKEIYVLSASIIFITILVTVVVSERSFSK